MQLIIKKVFISLILLGSSVSFAGGTTSVKSACEFDEIQIRVPTLSALESGRPIYRFYHEYKNMYDLKCVPYEQSFLVISRADNYVYLNIESLEASRRALNPYPATREFITGRGSFELSPEAHELAMRSLRDHPIEKE